MKVLAIIADDRKPEGWEEEHDLPDGWPSVEVQRLIDRFNATLRAHEIPRRLVRIVSQEPSKPKPREHKWEKTSLVTERGGYDRMRCERCGATGKRYGLGQFGVKIDPRQPAHCFEGDE
jgi:hypothetical protein